MFELLGNPVSYLELVSVALNFTYLILLLRQNIWCWPFGIAGSLTSIILFLDVQLYSEAILYAFYALAGFYGWTQWKRITTSKSTTYLQTKSFQFHGILLAIGAVGTLLLGSFFYKNTEAKVPFADAFSTSFSFVATYLEAQKVVEGWLYWIVLNLFSVGLYYSRNYQLYAVLMVVYTVLSVYGYVSWRKQYKSITH